MSARPAVPKGARTAGEADGTPVTAPLDFDSESPSAVRAAIRSGAFRGFTNTVARGHVQGNLMIVPADHADVLINHASGARNHAAIAPTYGKSIGPAMSAVTSAATATLIQNPRAITIRQLVRSASITPMWRSTMR